MYPHCAFALRVFEDVDAIERIGMHGRHDPPWVVGAYRDEAEIEGSAQVTDLLECGAMREVVGGAVVVDVFWEFGDGAVSGIAVVWYVSLWWC